MNKDGGTSHQHDDEAEIDGCMCDVDLDATEATTDAELPVAAGGLQAIEAAHDGEDGIDGCDVDFNVADVTADEDLPIATGGVA